MISRITLNIISFTPLSNLHPTQKELTGAYTSGGAYGLIRYNAQNLTSP
jgi:hypothetical protein